MISVTKAEHIVLSRAKVLPAELCSLAAAQGRILRESILLDRDQPPFDKSLVDGIAINFTSWHNGRRTYAMEGIAAAGQSQHKLQHRTGCFKIMTGAVIPRGCDTVIPIEQVKINDSQATITGRNDLKINQYIQRQGSNGRRGKTVLMPGCRLAGPQIGIIAAVGKKFVRVTVRPRVAIIATGDELVEIGGRIARHQTRLSNSYALQALLQQTGLCQTELFHLPDNPSIMTIKLRKILRQFDILVLSGGVSMGDYDYVPGVLKKLGVRVLFHKVRQKPGKPFWFGQLPNGPTVFALPGNPVSTQACAARYVIPFLKKLAGVKVPQLYGILKKDFICKTELTFFLPVQLNYDTLGKILVTPLPIGGSGDFAALAKADGIIELSGGPKNFKNGQSFKFYSWN